MKIYRLSKETNPYSKQHEENPVDCFSWSKEALDKARLEYKPILLFIRYKVFHWHHVVPHKYFGVKDTADIINKHSINIKVSGEERPDLDKIHQTSQIFLNQIFGRWSLIIFLPRIIAL